MKKTEKEHAEWLKERLANETLLEELRKIQIAEYKRDKLARKKNFRRRNTERMRKKISAMDMAKLEELISLEHRRAEHHAYVTNPRVKDNEFGAHLIKELLRERMLKSPDFKMTDKKYQKFAQLNNSFMETYKLAKAEAKAIEKTLKESKQNNPANPLLKTVNEPWFRINIIIKPVFFHWDKLYNRRTDYEWLQKNKELENKYKLYEALEWAFERYDLWEFEGDQDHSFIFEHNENEKEWDDKDPDGNLGPTNWAFEWIPHDSKYYWKNRFCYVMHRLGAHTNIFTLDDILEIKRLEVSFKIEFGEIPVKHNSSEAT
ncbi:MAG: hypothetical protein FWC26_09255 [Fibromonadales bacterium]|nr:hypothetical protein [Fibromonadales bacterium]